MHKSLFVVDDFYADPGRVRRLALDQASWLGTSHGGQRYYCSQTAKGYYTDAVVRQFESVLGFGPAFDPARMGFGVFAFYDGASNVGETTHFDDTDWSGIVYLVPPQDCRGGITFYRHRPTGLHGPPAAEQLNRLGFGDMDEFITEIYLPAKKDPDAWEPTAHVAMRFNRLVLLNGGRLFHRASSGFGSSPADGRLTQRFFFNEGAGSHAA